MFTRIVVSLDLFVFELVARTSYATAQQTYRQNASFLYLPLVVNRDFQYCHIAIVCNILNQSQLEIWEEPNVRPPGAVSSTAETIIYGSKFCCYERRLANVIALAYTARTVFILTGYALAA